MQEKTDPLVLVNERLVRIEAKMDSWKWVLGGAIAAGSSWLAWLTNLLMSK